MKLEAKTFRFFNAIQWFYVVLIGLWMLPLTVWAESLPVNSENYRVETVANSASWEFFINRENAIYWALSMSNDGKTLWAGTDIGLEKRDGVSGEITKVYIKQDGIATLKGNALLPDAQGGLWMNTGSGLAHLKSDDTWDIFNQENSKIPDNNVRALLLDEEGGLWIGTHEGGLAHLKSDNTWEVFTEENSGIPHDYNSDYNYITNIESGDQGGLLIGTRSGGIARFKSDGTWEVFNKDNSELPNNYVTAILSDKQGGVWIGSWEGGLAHLKSDATWEVFNKDNSEFPDEYNVLSELASDGQEGIWIGTEHDGLAHFKANATWDVFNIQNSELPDNHITTLVSDKQGGLWIGTWNGGLVHLKTDGVFEIPPHAKNNDYSDLPLTSREISVLFSDEEGGIWLGNATTLFHLNQDNTWEKLAGNKTWEAFGFECEHECPIWISIPIVDEQGDMRANTQNGIVYIKNGTIRDIFTKLNGTIKSDGKGGIWVRTKNGWGYGELNHINSDGTWDVFNDENSDLPSNKIGDMLSDGKGGIWIGTQDGLAHLKSDGIWDIFNENNSALPADGIRNILHDDNYGIWVTSYSGAVNRNTIAHLNSNGTWEVFTEDNSDLPDDDVTSWVSDGQGGIWIGTQWGGLAHLKSDSTWDLFNGDNSGLLSNTIHNIERDGYGGIWLETSGIDSLAHLLLTGSPEIVAVIDSSDIKINWFLNSAPFHYQNVQYVELQSSLSETANYETVYDSSGKPARFYADYTACPDPRINQCQPAIEGHTSSVSGSGDTSTKGYRLNTSITIPQFSDGLPRYYRLVAIVEKNGKLAAVTNHQEATLITPSIDESGNIPKQPQRTLSIEQSIVTVSWNPVDNADGYKLFYAPYPDPKYIGEINMYEKTSITFDATGIAFYTAVKAYNSNGTSDFSNLEIFDLR